MKLSNLFFVLFVLQLKDADKNSSISSFKDPSIATSHAVLDLVDAIRPGIVRYELVSAGVQVKVSNATWNLLQRVTLRVYIQRQTLKSEPHYKRQD